MKNPAQLKATIKKLAKEKNISAPLLLQNYMLERFLERLAESEYRDNYIIKGGFLIASIVGLDTRSTMDMDMTIKGQPLKEDTISRMINDIIRIDLEDDISFELLKVTEIRETDDYTGYRVSLTAKFSKINQPLKLDITTGDAITPREIEYHYKLMLEERKISVLAYNLATILAEKLETIITRGDQNTRPRDFYDIYILEKLQSSNIDYVTLDDALYKTSERRNSKHLLKDYKEIIDNVMNSDEMQTRWLNYQKDFDYAKDIHFRETCLTILQILDKIIK